MSQVIIERLLQKASKAFERSAPSEALNYLRQALKIAPSNPLLLLRSGIAFQLMGRIADAERFYVKAINSAPSMGEAHNNLGKLYLEQGKNMEAAAAFRMATTLLPHSPFPLAALSSALQRMKMYGEAEDVCRQSITTFPNFAEAHHNLALLLLLQGRYSEGWKEYEWRWQTNRHPFIKREITKPVWNGEPIHGKRLLIHAEQGLGDTIQFARYIPLAAAASGAYLIIECHPSLHSVISTIDGSFELVSSLQNQSDFDYNIPLLSLPALFNTAVDSIPFSSGYIRTFDLHTDMWMELTAGNTPRFKVGVCWTGNQLPDPNRSCPFEKIQSVLEIEGVDFFSLQLEKQPIKDCSNLFDFASRLHDFSDTAALINQLDLVISIDTSVAHLSGGMGKLTWLLLPFASDWRWGIDKETSLWYESIKIFRQQKPADWECLLARVKEELVKLIR